MINFIDENNKRHRTIATIKRKKAINGEKSLKGVIYENDHVIRNIGLGWKLDFEGERYVVIYAEPVDLGNVVQLEFDAVHQFFYDFLKSTKDTVLNGSNTMRAYLDFVFRDSGYSYLLDASINAFSKENFGMENRLSLFNNLIKTSGAEFVVNERVVRIVNKTGKDLSTIVRKGLNMQDIKIEKNIKDFITYRKGYGAFIDEENHSLGRLEVEYTSPLAAIYGRLEGDPVIDERYTVPDNLYNRLKDSVENSYEVSIQLTMEDLTKAGYEYKQPQEGDLIMAINEDLGFQKKVRIISYESDFDTEGKLIDHQIVCGSEGIAAANVGGGIDDAVQEELDKIKDEINKAYIAANGKNMIYRGPDAPGGEDLRVNDLWYKAVGDGEYKMHLWTGAYWKEVIVEDARFNNLDASNITFGVLRGPNFQLDLGNDFLLMGTDTTDYKLYFDGQNLFIKLNNGNTIEQEILKKNTELKEEINEGIDDKITDIINPEIEGVIERIENNQSSIEMMDSSLKLKIDNSEFQEFADGTMQLIGQYQSDFEATARKWDLNFTNVTGNNLLKNSVGFSDTKFWEVYGNVETEQSEELEVLGSGSAFILPQYGEIKQNFVLETDKYYTFSFLYKMNYETAQARMQITLSDIEGDLTTTNETQSYSMTAADDYQLGTIVFKSKITNMQLKIKNNSGSIKATNILINEGENRQLWSSHRNEKYTTNILQDEEGIKVKNIDEQGRVIGYTEQTPFQFAGYYDDIEVFKMAEDAFKMNRAETKSLKIGDIGLTTNGLKLNIGADLGGVD